MAEIEMIPVDSTNLDEVGYDADALELHVLFVGSSDTIYVYEGVPFDTYTALLNAESKGRYFHNNIRGRFDFRKEES
jgi:hypothetical protein